MSLRLIGSLTEVEILTSFDQALRAQGGADRRRRRALAVVSAANAPAFSLPPDSSAANALVAGGTAVYTARNITPWRSPGC